MILKINLNECNLQTLHINIDTLKVNKEALEYFKDWDSKNLINKVSYALKGNKFSADVLNISHQNQPLMISQSNLSANRSPLKYTFSCSVSYLDSKIANEIYVSKSPNIEICIVKDGLEKHASVLVRVYTETNSQWFVQLLLKENKFWYLSENQVEITGLNKKLSECGKIYFKINTKELLREENLEFELLLYEIDDKIVEYKKDIINNYIGCIFQELDLMKIKNFNQEDVIKDNERTDKGKQLDEWIIVEVEEKTKDQSKESYPKNQKNK